MSNKPVVASWVEEEFAEAALEDPRQVRRLMKMAEDFMKNPQASINEASGQWAASKGAYRFFASEIAADDILSGHRQRTIQRIREQGGVVLAIQDTTTLNFTSQRAKRGLGSIGNEQSQNRGFFCHATLAVDEEGCPLGVLEVQSYTRKPEPVKRARTGQAQEGENVRWLQSLASGQQAAESCGAGARIVSVADREADFYEFFAYALEEAPLVDVLVRAKHDRELEGGRLFGQLRAQPVAGVLEVEVPRSAGKAARVARLEIRFQPVRLKAPAHWRDAQERPVLDLWAIEAWEAKGAAGGEPICWRLLTTLPVAHFAAAVEKVRFYTLRWKIEVWHRILKSGCQFEAHQLESLAALERVLRVDAIIAWRVMFLLTQGRAHPQLCCTVLLEDYQWKALHAFIKKSPPTGSPPPTLGEAMLWIARLGGFLARKGDGHPGPEVLRRGLTKLDTIAEAWLVFSPQTCG